jgi:hypothetical protein
MLIAAPVAETGAPEDVVNDPVSWMLEPLVVKLRPVNPVEVSVVMHVACCTAELTLKPTVVPPGRALEYQRN